MSARPDISVVIATWQPGESLRTCLSSIDAQHNRDAIEVIVVDGGSSDGTPDLLRRLEGASVDRWKSEADDGIYDAWNRGIDLAQGRWISFLGADDLLAGTESLDALLKVADQAFDQDGIRIVYGRNLLLDANGTAVDVAGEPWSALQHRFRREMVLPHPGTLHHRELFDQHGRFDTSFKIAGDYDLLLRELRDGQARFAGQVTVALVGDGGVSRSWRGARTSMHESRRARRRNGVPVTVRGELSTWLRHWISVGIGRLLGGRRGVLVKQAVRRLLGRERGPHASEPSGTGGLRTGRLGVRMAAPWEDA